MPASSTQITYFSSRSNLYRVLYSAIEWSLQVENNYSSQEIIFLQERQPKFHDLDLSFAAFFVLSDEGVGLCCTLEDVHRDQDWHAVAANRKNSCHERAPRICLSSFYLAILFENA